MRNILPWLLIELITRSSERSADSNEIVYLSTTIIYTILVQQHCSTRGHLITGVPWTWVCENFPLEKESLFSWKFPGIKGNCASPTTQPMVVKSTVPVCPSEIFSFPAPGCRLGIAQMCWPWVKGRRRQRIWLWKWRFESWLGFYLRNIKWIPRHLSPNAGILSSYQNHIILYSKTLLSKFFKYSSCAGRTTGVTLSGSFSMPAQLGSHHKLDHHQKANSWIYK